MRPPEYSNLQHIDHHNTVNKYCNATDKYSLTLPPEYSIHQYSDCQSTVNESCNVTDSILQTSFSLMYDMHLRAPKVAQTLSQSNYADPVFYSGAQPEQ